MCVVSMITDHYLDKWKRNSDWAMPILPTQQEIDEFRRLLERAREYDRQHNQPDCGLEEKRAAVKKLADELGIDVSFI